MITVTNFPPANRFLLDGNNTQIRVTSTNGVGYYFRATIAIDGVLFDEQGWSRKDDFTATKDLLYLYNAYFKPYFLGEFETGLLEQPNFKKRVSITIEERLIATDAVVGTVVLPDFFLIYNVKSALFNDIDKLTVLGLSPETLKMKRTGTIVIPFFANPTAEDVKVTIYDDLDNIIHTETITVVNDKKIFIYTLKLLSGMVTSATLFLRAKVEVGATSFEKIYNVIKLPNFEVKEIVFQNNYGFYIPAYFDGDFEDSRGFKVQSYEQYDSSTAVYAIEEEGTYTINTGNLSFLEKDIVGEVSNSIDCYFFNENKYKKVTTATKKRLNEKSRTNIYAEDLVLKFNVGLPFSNLNVNGTITGDDVEPEETATLLIDLVTFINFEPAVPPFSNPTYGFQVDFTSGFSIFQLFIQIRATPADVWSAPIELTGQTSPQYYGVFFTENHQSRLFAYFNGNIVYSNIVTHTA